MSCLIINVYYGQLQKMHYFEYIFTATIYVTYNKCILYYLSITLSNYLSKKKTNIKCPKNNNLSNSDVPLQSCRYPVSGHGLAVQQTVTLARVKLAASLAGFPAALHATSLSFDTDGVMNKQYLEEVLLDEVPLSIFTF